MNTKILALYLPQFHCIPENDEWWGKGFTEWTNVRKAQPLFNGHEQPRKPLDDNYYDLSNPDAIRHQAALASKYGIDGFCFYHYWFSGKMLLEKPAELLLENKDISLPFCFSWANEPWTRSWDGKTHQVIMPQDYSSEADWTAHFNYLLPFFTDERYIKVDGCPIFVIYKTRSIPRCADMMNLWNELARKAGFDHIHFVETIRGGSVDGRNLPVCARMDFEPARANYCQSGISLNYKRVRRYLIKTINHLCGTRFMLNKPFSFAEVANRALRTVSPSGTYGGAFIGWDNTARRGLSNTIVLPPTREEFKQHLRDIITKTHEIYKTDYVFVNSWNEWAEGTYLEPDERHRYEYLEVIAEVKRET